MNLILLLTERTGAPGSISVLRIEALVKAGAIERLLAISLKGGAAGGAADGALELISSFSEVYGKRVEGARSVAALEASFQ